MEDIRVDGRSDYDYNDIIFQVRGATGTAVNLNDVIDTNEDWRDLELGQLILSQLKNRAPELDQSIPEIVLTPQQPTFTINLSSIFSDPDGDVLTYEIIDDGEGSVGINIIENHLTLTKGVGTEIQNIAIRVLDQFGASYIHSFAATVSDLSTEQIQVLNSAVDELAAASQFIHNDLTAGMSSPLAVQAINRLEGILATNPNLGQLLVQSNELISLGLTPSNVVSLNTILDAPALGNDIGFLDIDGLLSDTVSDGGSGAINLYQINAIEVVKALNLSDVGVGEGDNITVSSVLQQLANSEQPRVAVIDSGQHGEDVSDVIAQVNPSADITTYSNSKGVWAQELIRFVESLEKSGHDHGVVNLSFDLVQIDAEGRVTTRYELTEDEQLAIQYAREHNVLLVVSSGNTGDEMSALGRATQEFDNVVTVGASNLWGHRADYASYGESLDLVAPGGEFEGDHTSFVGTSKSAAYVSSTASLVWTANPDLNYQQVKQLLIETAVDLQTPGWDAETGAGLLNVEAAIRLALITRPEVLGSIGSVSLRPFSGVGRVQAALRNASPETELAIAELRQQQERLVARLTQPSMSLANLEQQASQRTQTASYEFDRIRTEATIVAKQVEQLTTEQSLAAQHDRIEHDHLATIDERLDILKTTLTNLEQQKTLRENDYQQRRDQLHERIEDAEREYTATVQERETQAQKMGVLPTPEQLRSQAAQYRQQATILVGEAAQQQELANKQTILKGTHLQQVDLALQTRTLLEALAQRLETQAALLESAVSEAGLQLGYKQIATQAQQLQRQSQSGSDWHQENLEQLSNTTGLAGLLRAAQRETHTRQRNQFEQLVSQATLTGEKASAMAGLPDAKLDALDTESQIRQRHLQAEQDLLALIEAEHQQQLAGLNLEIKQTQVEIDRLRGLQTEADNRAAATQQRATEIQQHLEELQTDWEVHQQEWQNFLALNSSFLPTAVRQTAIADYINDLDREEVRVQSITAELQAELSKSPNELLQTQLTEAKRYLSELEQDRLLAQFHQSVLDVSSSTAGQQQQLLDRPTELAQKYQAAMTQQQSVAESLAEIEAELATIQNTAPTERAELATLRDRLEATQIEFKTAASERDRLARELAKATQDLGDTTLQLENRIIQLQILSERDAALAKNETFHHQAAEAAKQNRWYWNDRTGTYQYNDGEAAAYQEALQHASFMADERNRIFAQIRETEQEIAALQSQKSQQQQAVNTLEAKRSTTDTQAIDLEAKVTSLEMTIAPLTEIVDPVLSLESELKAQLKDVTEAMRTAKSTVVDIASQRVTALQRSIDVGILVGEADASYFAREIEPQVRAYIDELRSQAAIASAQGSDPGFAAAATHLEKRLTEALSTLKSLELQQELQHRQQIAGNETRLQSLEALLASENAAQVVFNEATPDAYQNLEQAVEIELEQAVNAWTQNFQTTHRFTKDLGDDHRALSTQLDRLLTEIETDFADPHGQYFGSETELSEALSALAVDASRETELSSSIAQTIQDLERLQQRLDQDASFWEQIAPIVARYGIDSKEALQALLVVAANNQQHYQHALAQAKAERAEFTARGSAALSQVMWNEEQAKAAWERSRKAGPTWTEQRCGSRGKKSGCETITGVAGLGDESGVT